jgi:DNA primase
MRIANETIERIKQSVDIVEVVGDFVSLKKRGVNYQACCPFHNEKSPSFNVNPVRQIFKCFGCGAAGDSIKFVMDIEGIGYTEALRFLAQKYNIEVEEQAIDPEQLAVQNERESLFIVLNFAQQYFHNLLLTHPDGESIGLSYFRGRGFSDPTIKAFGLGYSLNEWDGFLKTALQKGYKLDVLEKAGLVSHRENENRHYDRFRGRVMFPIHNVAGKVIAFGARILTSGEAAKNQPKYLNSPETDVYHKSQILYGIAQAKNAIRQEDMCYLVEGYTDVVSLYQAGIQNVVASSGTSLTEEQIKLIGRFTPNITILYDGDAAGIKAALRGLDMVLEEGLNVSLVTFPDGEDPDSYVFKVGAEGFKTHVRNNTKDFISFKTEMLLRDAADNPFKKAEAIGEIVASITKINDPIKRQVFFQRTAEQMKVDEQTLISESNKLARKQQEQPTKNHPRPVVNQPPSAFELGDLLTQETQIDYPPAVVEIPKPKSFLQEQECVRLLICYGNQEIETGITMCHYILSQLADVTFEMPIFEHILNIFRTSFGHGETPDTNYFINHIDPEIQQLAINLVSERYVLSDNWEKREIKVPNETERLHEAAFGNILRLKKCIIEKKMTELLALINETNHDEAHQMELLRQHIFFKSKDKEIAQMLGIVVSG